MLIDQIKEFRSVCRRVANQLDSAKIKARCLSTLIGEIESKTKGKSKEITDELVIGVIQKFIKNIDLTIATYDNDYHPPKLVLERELLESYLPKKLTETELECAIKVSIACTHSPNIGSVMKDLKESYKGRFDGSLAKEIILREL